MPTQMQPNEPENVPPARPPLWAERMFLNDGGRMRPIIRVMLFAAAVLLVNLEVGSAIFNFTRELSFWWQLFWSSLVLAVVLLFLSWIFVRLVDGRAFYSLGLNFRRGWGKQLSIGFGVGVALQLLVMAILAGTHSVRYSDGILYDIHFWKRVGLNAGLFFFAASVEELTFRGYAFQRLIESVGIGGAIIAPAVIFGLAHSWNPSATFFSALNTMLAGVVLAVPYVRTRSMWAQIGLHWSWNLTLATIVSLPVSGIGFGPSLFVAQDSGPRWLNGGPYGPEGGAAVTIVSVAAILWLARTRWLTPSHGVQEDLQ
jgi:uncharacterized protein